jgi:hypothetical protein
MPSNGCKLVRLRGVFYISYVIEVAHHRLQNISFYKNTGTVDF